MKTMALSFRWIALLACVSAPALFAAAGKSDLLPTDKRATAIATGTRLARPGEMPAVAPDIVSPFSPPDFDLTDAPAATSAKAGGAPSAATAAPATGPVTKMSSARDILETLTPLISPTGSILLRGEWLLAFTGGQRFKVGDTLNVGYAGESTKYPFEIVRISATDFTLRYQGEVKTRAIVNKPSSSKSP